MPTPTCPECRSEIPRDDINVAKDVAYCRRCNVAAVLSDLAENADLFNCDLNNPPHGTWHHGYGIEKVTGASHRSLWGAIGALAVMLFWNGIVSVFVAIAVSGTMHVMGIDAPEWFPEPEMNDSPMGTGMVIFLWCFLTPFIVIGFGMVGAFLLSLGGKTEVRIGQDRGSVFTGIGPIGWSRRFIPSEIVSVRLLESYANNNAPQEQVVLEQRSGKLVKFGSMLKAERRKFLAAGIKHSL